VSKKDFMDAVQDGMLWGLALMAITMLNNYSDPNTNIWGSPKKDPNENQTQIINDPNTGEPIGTTGPPSGRMVLPPVQGLQIMGQGQGHGRQGSLAGGLMSGAGGMSRGLFGKNPFAAGILGALIGTIQAYQGQDDEVTFTVLQKDAEITDISLVEGSGELEQVDEDIEVTVEGLEGDKGAATAPQPLVRDDEAISQGIETLRTIFTNISGFITTEEQPKYSELKVEGIRHKYEDKTYDKDDFYEEEGGFMGFFDKDVLNKDKTELDEKEPENLEQRYHLEFNSVPPQVDTPQDLGLLNCQDGTRIGSTGYDALPKIKFQWKWGQIDEDECNEDNENAIYCDGTQFSMALLKKINTIAEFVEENASDFECPSPLEDTPSTNEIGTFDIGISSVSTI